MKSIQANDKTDLIGLIEDAMESFGNHCDLNHIDVSGITDMSYLFNGSAFNGDISQWDVSNVNNMESMFAASLFNGNISDWNVGNVRNMSRMFAKSKFQGDIALWNVENVESMDCMFQYSVFNHSLGLWDVQHVRDMSHMFEGSTFNGNIALWDVSRVKSMQHMFEESAFNRDISLWRVRRLCNIYHMVSRPYPLEHLPSTVHIRHDHVYDEQEWHQDILPSISIGIPHFFAAVESSVKPRYLSEELFAFIKQRQGMLESFGIKGRSAAYKIYNMYTQENRIAVVSHDSNIDFNV